MIEKYVCLSCLCPNFGHILSLLSVLRTLFTILSVLRTFGLEKLRHICSIFYFFLHFFSLEFLFFDFSPSVFLLRFFVRVSERKGKKRRRKEGRRKREERKEEKERRKEGRERHANI